MSLNPSAQCAVPGCGALALMLWSTAAVRLCARHRLVASDRHRQAREEAEQRRRPSPVVTVELAILWATEPEWADEDESAHDTP